MGICFEVERIVSAACEDIVEDLRNWLRSRLSVKVDSIVVARRGTKDVVFNNKVASVRNAPTPDMLGEVVRRFRSGRASIGKKTVAHYQRRIFCTYTPGRLLWRLNCVVQHHMVEQQVRVLQADHTLKSLTILNDGIGNAVIKESVNKLQAVPGRTAAGHTCHPDAFVFGTLGDKPAALLDGDAGAGIEKQGRSSLDGKCNAVRHDKVIGNVPRPGSCIQVGIDSKSAGDFRGIPIVVPDINVVVFELAAGAAGLAKRLYGNAVDAGVKNYIFIKLPHARFLCPIAQLSAGNNRVRIDSIGRAVDTAAADNVAVGPIETADNTQVTIDRKGLWNLRLIINPRIPTVQYAVEALVNKFLNTVVAVNLRVRNPISQHLIDHRIEIRGCKDRLDQVPVLPVI